MENDRFLALIGSEHKDALVFALNLYKKRSLDFVDCLLIGMNRIEGASVFSFDKKLNAQLISRGSTGEPSASP